MVFQTPLGNLPMDVSRKTSAAGNSTRWRLGCAACGGHYRGKVMLAKALIVLSCPAWWWKIELEYHGQQIYFDSDARISGNLLMDCAGTSHYWNITIYGLFAQKPIWSVKLKALKFIFMVFGVSLIIWMWKQFTRKSAFIFWIFNLESNWWGSSI